MSDDLLKKYKKVHAEVEIAKLKRNRDTKNFRKDRARRLITKGALLEKYFECSHLSTDETEELLKIFANYINSNKPNKFKKDF